MKANSFTGVEGGYGYIISRDSVWQIRNIDSSFSEKPYENLLIAKLLNKKGIYPKNIENLQT